MKVLMATAQHWTSPFRVGSHHLAHAFVQNGWEVGFVSDPISPWHYLKGADDALRARFSIFQAGGKSYEEGRLWAYVPGAFLTPHVKPILRSEWVHRRWVDFTLPSLKTMVKEHGFDEVDLLYLDVPTQQFWLEEVHYRKSVFRISDRYSAFAKFPAAAQRLALEVAGKVDLTLYSAHNLEDYTASLKPHRTMYFPNGVDYDFFRDSPKEIPVEYSVIPRPRLVYAGALDFWFDYAALNEVARRLPHFSFVLIGPNAQARKIVARTANIHLLGPRPYAQLPGFYAHADAGIIPFDVAAYPDLIHAVHPLKLYEMMACGIPVVASRWRELETLKSPAILCDTVEEFVLALQQAVDHTPDRRPMLDFASAARWQNRLEQLLSALDFNADIGDTR